LADVRGSAQKAASWHRKNVSNGGKRQIGVVSSKNTSTAAIGLIVSASFFDRADD